MSETSAPPSVARRRLPLAWVKGGALGWLPVVVLAPLVVAQLVFFAVRAAHLLGYPFPLDYGEGPLLAQAQQVRAGTPIWALYTDPGAAPYAVVNYPPVYLLAVTCVSLVLPGTAETAPLLAGRLVSLVATLGCVAALWILSGEPRTKNQEPEQRSVLGSWFLVLGSRFSVLLTLLALLGIPIVREWAALMRVDALGVCLGVFGVLAVRRAWLGGGSLVWGALLLALSLFVKPSLIAAPAAALLWLLFRDWRMALRLALLLGTLGGGAFALLHFASGGWFFTHVVAANANPLDQQLGASFWDGQLEILWPLFAAGALGGMLTLIEARRSRQVLLLPIYYTLFGAIVALGVGKVGAYLNYFLELYVGLVWLAAHVQSAKCNMQNAKCNVQSAKCEVQSTTDIENSVSTLHFARFTNRASTLHVALCTIVHLTFPLLVAASLLRYYPLWSETYLKPYGLIEGQSPARVAFGSYGVWQDLQREAEVLAALGRVNGALVEEVRAANAPIFTDLPGIAAQAGQLARHQAFEHRQLYDGGVWDQRPLLRDMANGRVPLVALDYLGNWLTPEMIALITYRYAQDGSRGPYDLYRPVDAGQRTPLALDLADGLRVEGVRLARPGDAQYSGGELLTATLEWRYGTASTPACDMQPCDVVLALLDSTGATVAKSERPLLYGVLSPGDWGADAVQHMQSLALPPLLPPGDYTLAVALRAGDEQPAPSRLAAVTVGETTGRVLGEGGYFVPAPLLEAWVLAGGYEGPGDPIMPAVPFEGFTAQCFQRACFQLVDGEVEPVPLAELIALGLTGPRDLSAANLGEEFLRLPGGVAYRWP
jgi:hypothetical protein